LEGELEQVHLFGGSVGPVRLDDLLRTTLLPDRSIFTKADAHCVIIETS
jgi:hypothetical protein